MELSILHKNGVEQALSRRRHGVSLWSRDCGVFEAFRVQLDGMMRVIFYKRIKGLIGSIGHGVISSHAIDENERELVRFYLSNILRVYKVLWKIQNTEVTVHA